MRSQIDLRPRAGRFASALPSTFDTAVDGQSKFRTALLCKRRPRATVYPLVAPYSEYQTNLVEHDLPSPCEYHELPVSRH